MSHQERNGVRAAYIHKAEFLDERRRMLPWWADFLDANRQKGGARLILPNYTRLNNTIWLLPISLGITRKRHLDIKTSRCLFCLWLTWNSIDCMGCNGKNSGQTWAPIRGFAIEDFERNTGDGEKRKTPMCAGKILSPSNCAYLLRIPLPLRCKFNKINCTLTYGTLCRHSTPLLIQVLSIFWGIAFYCAVTPEFTGNRRRADQSHDNYNSL